MKQPLVSVCITSYNQEQYIAACLDGVLMQECDFEYELAIIDDASTDGTIGVIKEYQKKHPHIRTVIHKENQFSKGGLAKMVPSLVSLGLEGKYVAFCEGDDYWTDPLKLQKQADFMEANPDCSLCSHKTKVVFEDGRPEFTMYLKDVNEPVKLTIEEYIDRGAFGFWTVSQLHRSDVIKETPSWIFEAPFADLPLKLHAGLRGKMGYIPEEMAVYRRGRTGAWSENEHTLEWNIQHIKDRNAVYNLFDKNTGYKYHDLVEKTNREWVMYNIYNIQNKFGRAAQPKLLFQYFNYLNKFDKRTIALWFRFLLGPKFFDTLLRRKKK